MGVIGYCPRCYDHSSGMGAEVPGYVPYSLCRPKQVVRDRGDLPGLRHLHNPAYFPFFHTHRLCRFPK